MELLIIRHGIAEALGDDESADEPGSDFDRRLTPRGHTRTVKALKGLRRIYPELDVIATSPLARAAETAAIAAKLYDQAVVTELPALTPGAPAETLRAWLADHPAPVRAALIGHEPHLSRWCGWMLCATQRPLFHLKKSGACLLSVTTPLAPGEAELLWLVTARQLRALSGG